MLGISEVNILPEYYCYESARYGNFQNKSKLVGKSFITEKTISHIFANKPFIPMTYSTIEFYEKILIENGYSVKNIL